MDILEWFQLCLFVGLLFALTKPVGLYLARVLDPEGKTWLDPVVRPVEKFIYRICGIGPKKEQSWQSYAGSLLIFSCTGMLFSYAVLRLQHALPLNPQGFAPVSPSLAFNTAASFTTNTDWQNYAGESTLSYLSQMAALVIHNFTSASTGIAVAAALVRGISRQSIRTIGNFWVDTVRVNLYLLLPLCIIYSLFLVSQGVIQNFKPYVTAQLTEPSVVKVVEKDAAGTELKDFRGNPIMTVKRVETQTIPEGPAASQVAIKMLGTNGGGFFNANAAHPFENPTPLSNFLQILSVFLIPSGLTYFLGRQVKNQGHGWTVWGTMLALFLAALLVCWWAEASGNPRIHALGSRSGGRQYGRQGGPLRDIPDVPLRHRYDGCLLRSGQRHA